MRVKAVDVQEVVADFMAHAQQAGPVVIGPNVAERLDLSAETDPFLDLEPIAAFKHKSQRLYGLNSQTLRYILGKPYARFLRPLTKALRKGVSLMRGITRR